MPPGHRASLAALNAVAMVRSWKTCCFSCFESKLLSLEGMEREVYFWRNMRIGPWMRRGRMAESCRMKTVCRLQYASISEMSLKIDIEVIC